MKSPRQMATLDPSSLPCMRRPMPRNIWVTKRRMLGGSRRHTLAPQLERAAFHFVTHEGNHDRFVQTKLRLDRLEWRAVFPRHFNDAGDFCGSEIRRQQFTLLRAGLVEGHIHPRLIDIGCARNGTSSVRSDEPAAVQIGSINQQCRRQPKLNALTLAASQNGIRVTPVREQIQHTIDQVLGR